MLGDRPSLEEPPVAEEDEPLTEEEIAEEEAYEAIEDWEVEDPEDAIAAGGRGRGRLRGARPPRPRGGRGPQRRPRVVQFLVAVWAELQRVQWPNRQALVTLTGVVLGFVLIVGGYLGLLDAIFSELIKRIL